MQRITLQISRNNTSGSWRSESKHRSVMSGVATIVLTAH